MARRVLHDEYFKRAKAEGYLARSAYKLLEIQERRRIMRAGDRVLDLGCAPGSWLQVAREIVGGRGVVVGVDLQEVRERIADNVFTIVGDMNELGAAELLGDSGRLFDVVISDMAPKTTGAGDGLRSVRLCERILDVVPGVLRRGGNLAMKVLEGETYPELLARTKGMFREARGLKPRASRAVSREMFVIATGYRGDAGGTADERGRGA